MVLLGEHIFRRPPVGRKLILSPPAAASPGSESPVGTTITMQNWRDYQNYMPDGMIALFQGKYFWKMPPDVAMPIGPTIIHSLPQPMSRPRKIRRSGQSWSSCPNGGLTLAGYNGGEPFPNPVEPHQGWKILANLVVPVLTPSNCDY